MLLFGHIGITLASAALGFGLKDKLRQGTTGNGVEENSLIGYSCSSNKRLGSSVSFFRSLANRFDIRFLLIGSILPDIIDKPIGVYLFWEIFSNGRIFSHTLLFLVLITVAAIFIKRYSGKTWGLALSIGTLFHLVLDQMWQMPKTLLWPILGLGFEKMETANYLGNIFYALLEEPAIYLPEIIGFMVFVWFAWELLRYRATTRFLKQGRITDL